MPPVRRQTQVGLGEDDDEDVFDLMALSQTREVWERLVGSLIGDDVPAVRALGAVCTSFRSSLLHMPWSTYRGEDGVPVFVPLMVHANPEVFADFCAETLRRLQELLRSDGSLEKKRDGYALECRGLERQASLSLPESRVAVHQTFHFFNAAQLDRKVCTVIAKVF